MAQEKLPDVLVSPNENLSDTVNVSHCNCVKQLSRPRALNNVHAGTEPWGSLFILFPFNLKVGRALTGCCLLAPVLSHHFDFSSSCTCRNFIFRHIFFLAQFSNPCKATGKRTTKGFSFLSVITTTTREELDRKCKVGS